MPSDKFGKQVFSGEFIEWLQDGFTIRAYVQADDAAEAPWEREDGHGPVSDWTTRDKRPGERPLNQDRSSKRFYDFAEAVKIARRDGWGCAGGRKEGETDAAYAARAAEEDFKRLKAWCNDEWQYVGICVAVRKQGIELTNRYEAALWGIESDCGDYCNEVARELAEEAIKKAREFIADLVKE